MPRAERDSRVVVTGGAGFIGSHVVDAFLAEGCEVLALDDLSTGDPGKVAAEAELEVLDVVDARALERAIARVRPGIVCHLAAQASVTAAVRDPARDLTVNVRGTFNVCEAARKAAATLVFASTGGALYGDRAPVPTAEEFPPAPLSPYGASKLSGEAYVATWGRLHSLPNAVVRLANVYGPRQNAEGEAGVVAIFSGLLRRSQPPTVFGDGLQTRDYVHVRDVARAFVLASRAGRPGTFNIGCGIEVTVLELLAGLQTAADTSLSPRFEPLRAGELLRSALDSSHARRELGWRPEVELERGLRETVESYRAA